MAIEKAGNHFLETNKVVGGHGQLAISSVMHHKHLNAFGLVRINLFHLSDSFFEGWGCEQSSKSKTRNTQPMCAQHDVEPATSYKMNKHRSSDPDQYLFRNRLCIIRVIPIIYVVMHAALSWNFWARKATSLSSALVLSGSNHVCMCMSALPGQTGTAKLPYQCLNGSKPGCLVRMGTLCSGCVEPAQLNDATVAQSMSLGSPALRKRLCADCSTSSLAVALESEFNVVIAFLRCSSRKQCLTTHV
jgi:hypothetical protein